MAALDAQEWGQALGRAMHAARVGIGTLVHRAGFLLRYVVEALPLQRRGYSTPDIRMTSRSGDSSHVWRLRGTTALDGTHQSSADAAVVHVRSAILGFRLPPVDCLSFLALRQNVCSLDTPLLPLHLTMHSGSFIDPSWFALDASRGIETPSSKLFMRSTVILSDYAIYVPAVWLFTRVWHSGRSRRTQVWIVSYSSPYPSRTVQLTQMREERSAPHPPFPARASLD